MHFNKRNRDKEERQKAINTKDPMPSDSPCTDGWARGQEDSGFTGKYWGLTPIPPSKKYLHSELLESKTHVLLIFALSAQCLELAIIRHSLLVEESTFLHFTLISANRSESV